jgi:hypothetical protein
MRPSPIEFATAGHEPVVRDRVEIAFQAGVHHMGVALLEQTIDFPRRIFAAAPRPEAVASGSKPRFEDGFNDHFERPF